MVQKFSLDSLIIPKDSEEINFTNFEELITELYSIEDVKNIKKFIKELLQILDVYDFEHIRFIFNEENKSYHCYLSEFELIEINTVGLSIFIDPLPMLSNIKKELINITKDTDQATSSYKEKYGSKYVADMLFGDKGFVTKNKGECETVMGRVTEYDSKVREDGGYDCSVTVLSQNAALIDHTFSKKQVERITSTLDYEIINWVHKNMDIPENYYKDSGADLTDIFNADWSGDDKQSNEIARARALAYANAFLTNKTTNEPFPSHIKTGVYYQMITDDQIEDAASDAAGQAKMFLNHGSKNLYITMGFFEDNILKHILINNFFLKSVMFL